jgi:hypothetical protein
VQRILKSEGVRFVQGVGRGEETVSAPPPEMRAETVAETVVPAAPSEPVLPAAALQRLRGALDELREADRVLSTLEANEPLRE